MAAASRQLATEHDNPSPEPFGEGALSAAPMLVPSPFGQSPVIAEFPPGPVSKTIYRLVPVVRACHAVIRALGDIGKDQPWAATMAKNLCRFAAVYLSGTSVLQQAQDPSAPTPTDRLLEVAGQWHIWVLLIVIGEVLWAAFTTLRKRRSRREAPGVPQ